MPYGDGFLKRTGKSLSNLAFETTKHSRILRRRMRIGALQKELKADLRDLGSLAYDAIAESRPALLEDEEARVLIARITMSKHEIERLREAIDRMSRARKRVEPAREPKSAEKRYPSPDDEPEAPEPVAAAPAKKRGLGKLLGKGKAKKTAAAAETPAPPAKKKGLGFLRKKEKKADAAPEAKPEKKKGLGKLLSKKK